MLKRISLLVQSVLVVLVWTGQLSACEPTANALAPTGSTQLPFTLDGDTFAVWSGGALLVVQGRFSRAPVFRTFDRNGNQVSQFTFAIQGAGLINIYDRSFARGWDGSLAIVGSAYSDDSRGASFLALVSPNGSEERVVRLSPFIPRAVTVAWDGTIWLAGEERKESGKDQDLTQHLIRHYDKSGKLLGSFIPWSSLGTDRHLGTPAAGSFLVSSKDRIGWYSPVSNAYIEFSLDGGKIDHYRAAEHPTHDLISVAICDDGSLFASTRTLNAGHQSGWGIFTLDRERGEWGFIPREGKWGALFGCDGTRLASSTDARTISWLRPAVE
jgi:hypothetical protein